MITEAEDSDEMQEELELEEDLNEIEPAVEESGLLKQVVGEIDNFYGNNMFSTPGKHSGKIEESKDSFTTAADSNSSITSTAMSAKKEELREKMGPDVFDYYYQFLYEQRHNPNTDEAKLRAQLNEWIGSNKTLKNLIFEMEQMIFKEM